MAMNLPPVDEQPPPYQPTLLFGNQSIFDRLRNSSFGMFQAAIDRLHDSIDNTFTLPRVVVIGSESAGKSSLLENITKCVVFPRDRDICTKMPIRLELITARSQEQESITLIHGSTYRRLNFPADILEMVQQTMDRIPEIISSDELIIRMCKMDIPTLTLIDLPGLRSFPVETKVATENLVRTYLSDPQTLVLCVVQASDRLTANPAIAMILEMNKQDRSILALSKVDLTGHNFENQVMDRILGRTPELNGLNFAGCVAVVNRVQDERGKERFELKDINRLEEFWFNQMLQPYMADKELINGAVQNMSVNNLLKQVDAMFHRFICDNWRPDALARINVAIQRLENEQNTLGPNPSILEPIALRDHVANLIKDKWPIVDAPVSGKNDLCPWGSREWAELCPWGSREWAELQQKNRSDFDWNNFMNHSHSPYVLFLEETVNSAFNNDTAMKTARFQEVRKFILKKTKETFDKSVEQHKPVIFKVVHAELDRRLGKEIANTTQSVQSIVVGMVLTNCLLPALQVINTLTLDKKIIVESAQASIARVALETRLMHLRDSHTQIENIHLAFGE